METKYISKSSVTLALQAGHIRKRHSGFKIVECPSYIKVVGITRPSARSVEYKFELIYWQNYNPSVRIVYPKLERNSKNENIPHMYSQTTLCLFKPHYREFKRTDWICNTIIPWISLWLYHYENWHLTGDWEGGGEHPQF